MTAIAGATGLSLGAAQTIPALLLPTEATDQWTLQAVQEPRLVRARDPAKPGWQWVVGRAWNGQVLRVGIDPKSLLVHRLEDEGHGAVAPTVTEYDPEANPAISPEDLSNDAPASL